MKRSIGVLTLMLLLSGSLLTPATATTAGSKCSVLNKKVRAGSVTLVCKKNSKGIKVWVKVLARKPSAMPTPTNTTTTQVTEPYERFGSLGKEYRELDAIARFHANRLRKPVDNGASTLFAESPSDPVNKYLAEATKMAVDIFRYYEPALPNQDIYLYYSFDWIDKYLVAQCPDIIEQVHANGRGTAGCGRFYVLNMTWGNTTSPVNLAAGVGHEIFHNVQISTTGGWRNFGSIWSRIPSWFREGSAQVGGGLVIAILDNPANPSYGNRRWDWPHDQGTCAGAFDLWNKSDEAFGHELTNFCEGGLGTIMVQMLVAKKQSVQPVLQVYQDVFAGKPFRAAVSDRFGIQFEDFMSEVKAKLMTLGWKF